MLINLRNALMASRRSPLPYDAEVEYLESTGTQYIDTGYIGGSATKVEILAASENTVSNAGLFGARKSYADGYLCSYSVWQKVSTGVRFDFSNASASNTKFATATWDTTGINTVVKDGPNNYLNGVAGANNNASTFDCEYPFYLFAINTAGSYGQAHRGKIYSCKIWDNGTLVRDYIPVRVGSVGYLYDRVSGKLYGNAGTGDFVLGPDVVPVEYIESHGTEWIDTGVPTYANAKMEFGFMLNSSSTAAVFGNRIDAGRGVFFGTGTNSVVYCNNPNQPISPSTTLSANTEYRVSQAGNNITINGIDYSTTGAADNADSMYLFARRNGSQADRIINGRVSYFRIVLNDTPLRSFRPVRVGTEGAMMDTLTRRIYRNAGTGAFTYGADLPYPIG